MSQGSTATDTNTDTDTVIVTDTNQGCPRNEINSCRRQILVDQRKTTVLVGEFVFRHPVDIVVDVGNNSIKLLIGAVSYTHLTLPTKA